MRVITHWPALVPAIERAGHEAVVAPGPDPFEPFGTDRATPFTTEADLPEPPVTARPRGAQRRPR